MRIQLSLEMIEEGGLTGPIYRNIQWPEFSGEFLQRNAYGDGPKANPVRMSLVISNIDSISSSQLDMRDY